jgi:hypothetical protein
MPAPGPDSLPLLKRVISEALAPMGINVMIFEINYNFQFKSHPEVAGAQPWSTAQVRELVDACRAKNIRLIPQINCLGHQSWAKNTGPLLTKHPELDETPLVPKDNTGIYCRSWCPLHPDINRIVFDLVDELVDAFQADAFHVGMDEVFLIGSDQCPRCKGKDPAELFSISVNSLHGHIAGVRKLTMLMWGDRLLDATTTGYGRWEAANNGTAPAIDRIPKDIIMCDWHYEKRDDYPSIPYFQQKGFNVWPSGWRKLEGTQALIAAEQKYAGERMLGHLFTVWSGGDRFMHALLGDPLPPLPPPARPNGASNDSAAQVAATIRATITSVGGKALAAK